MNEWTVIECLAVIAGLFITVGAPIIKLNSTIIKLNTTVESLDRRFGKFEVDNHNSHKRLWDNNTTTHKVLNDHETRIQKLEQ